MNPRQRPSTPLFRGWAGNDILLGLWNDCDAVQTSVGLTSTAVGAFVLPPDRVPAGGAPDENWRAGREGGGWQRVAEGWQRGGRGGQWGLPSSGDAPRPASNVRVLTEVSPIGE